MPDANMFLERRTHPRVSIKIPVKYQVEDDKIVLKKIDEWRESEKNGFTLNLSLGGMHLMVDQPLAVGSILNFEVFLLDKLHVVSIFAEVVWANKEGAGLHFLMMKPAEMDALKAFLDKASSSR